MEKYLGNKTSLLPLIDSFLKERVPDATSISDLFAGTTNVSRHFRREGMDVATGDLNRFSYVLGRAYLSSSGWPNLAAVDGDHDPAVFEALRFMAEKHIPTSARAEHRHSVAPLARALAILQLAAEKNRKPGVFHDNFCAQGKRSQFVSVRGSTGRRNYFSESNALILDGALEQLRSWRLAGQVSETLTMILLACIIEEVVITANVSGTFHDFSRDKLWPNALQRFTLRMPPMVLAEGSAEIVNADAVAAASAIRPHDVAYIDPPYNFRQYGAYYHLLNFVAAYPFLDDPEAYAADLSFVRGQNMADDHSSAFCFRDDFVGALRAFIERVPSQHVVLSYYGGRNHWNHWSTTDVPTDRGLRELSAIFRDRGLFDECEIVPVLSVRQNYQSRVGERKRLVDEYLLMGSRSRVPATKRQPLPALSANAALGIAEHFGHFVARRHESVTSTAAPSHVTITVG